MTARPVAGRSPACGLSPPRRADAVPVPPARSPPVRRVPALSAARRAVALLHQRASGSRAVRLRRPRQLREAARGQPVPGEPGQYRLLYRGEHAANSRSAAASSPCTWDRGIPLRTMLRSAFFFPFTLSVVTVGLTWLWLLDPVVGPFNYYLKAAGVPVRAWLADPSTAMWAIILTTVWWVTGYYLVIFLAGLQGVPRTCTRRRRSTGRAAGAGSGRDAAATPYRAAVHPRGPRGRNLPALQPGLRDHRGRAGRREPRSSPSTRPPSGTSSTSAPPAPSPGCCS